jgi:hypothetical protein
MNVFPIFLSPLLVIGAAFFTVRLMPFLEVTHHSLAPSARAVPGRKPRCAELSAPSHRSDRKAISVGIVHLSGQLDPRPIAFVGSCERCRFSFSFPLYRGCCGHSAEVCAGKPQVRWSWSHRTDPWGSGLFFPVLLGMCLHCFFSVSSTMNNVSPRYMSMVRRLLVKSGLVMFGCFPVVTSGVCKMF